MPPDLKPGFDAVTRLGQKFVTGVENNHPDLVILEHDCRVLLTLIHECLDDILADDTRTNQVNWLESWPLTYDLTGYSAQDIEDFKQTQRVAFQAWLDNSIYRGYRIILFDLITPGSNTKLKSYLSPVATSGPGGTGGTGVPTYPPH